MSPNGSILYATSEISGNGTKEGSLSVIDVETMKVIPARLSYPALPPGAVL